MGGPALQRCAWDPLEWGIICMIYISMEDEAAMSLSVLRILGAELK
jgi:hypothetical protein